QKLVLKINCFISIKSTSDLAEFHDNLLVSIIFQYIWHNNIRFFLKRFILDERNIVIPLVLTYNKMKGDSIMSNQLLGNFLREVNIVIGFVADGTCLERLNNHNAYL
ncbi:hypothetical protein ACJX0J_006109, partial [Zea mays]